MHACKRKNMHTPTHEHTHTCIHAHVHTHTHMHTYTPPHTHPHTHSTHTHPASITGDNLDLPYPTTAMRHMQSTMPAGPWLFPSATPWSAQEVGRGRVWFGVEEFLSGAVCVPCICSCLYVHMDYACGYAHMCVCVCVCVGGWVGGCKCSQCTCVPQPLLPPPPQQPHYTTFRW